MKNRICDYVIRKYGFENWRTVLVFRIFLERSWKKRAIKGGDSPPQNFKE